MHLGAGSDGWNLCWLTGPYLPAANAVIARLRFQSHVHKHKRCTWNSWPATGSDYSLTLVPSYSRNWRPAFAWNQFRHLFQLSSVHFSSSTSSVYYCFLLIFPGLFRLTNILQSQQGSGRWLQSQTSTRHVTAAFLRGAAPPPRNKLYVPLPCITSQCKNFGWDKITQITLLFLFNQICMWNLLAFETA